MRDRPDDPDRQPRPRKRLPLDDLLGQPQLPPHGAHLILEQVAQRLDQLEAQIVGQPADIVMRLDRRRRAARARARALHHIRVGRPLHQIVHLAQLPRRLLEDGDERLADPLPLRLRIRHARQLFEEAIARRDGAQVDLQLARERLLHLLALAAPQQPVVHEHAGQLIAHRAVRQRRRHRRVDAPAQPADHPPIAHLRANLRHCLADKVLGGPIARAAADVDHEVAQQLAAVGRMHHLGVKLDPVAPLPVGHRRDRNRLRRRQRLETVRQRRHAVAVAHPDRQRLRQPAQQRRVAALFAPLRDQRGRAELALAARRDAPAQAMRQLLHPVADAQRRQAAVQRPVRRARRVRVMHRRRPARQDDPPRAQPRNLLARRRGRRELAVDIQLAHPPRDQHRRLRPHVHDHDRLVRMLARHSPWSVLCCVLCHPHRVFGVRCLAEARRFAAMFTP